LKVGELKGHQDNSSEESDDSLRPEGPFGDGVPFGDPYWYQVSYLLLLKNLFLIAAHSH
jgi:hypothetical protein